MLRLMLRTLTLSAAFAAPALPALAQDMTPDTIDVVEVASANGHLGTFLDAALQAELAETLATTEDITVFVPIDEAFEAVDDLDALLADRATLADVLKLHVVPTAYLSGDIPQGETEVETLNGETLTLSNENGLISVTTPSGAEAMVIEADLEADNGVVHAINAVLMP